MEKDYEKYLGLHFFGKKGKKYTIGNFITEGGNGFIYECTDELNEIFVVKVLHDFGKKQIKLTNFNKEIALQESLNSPYIVKCIDSGILLAKDQRKNRPFYIMKKYQKSLDQMINDNEISPIDAYNYSLQLCRAIKTMHKRVEPLIHRDLKPENILYDVDEDKVLICDFGLTHIENGNDSTNDGFVGNVDYHAPEQKKRGGRKVGTYTDLYSLGLIINVLFTKEIATGENYKKIWECAPYFQYIDDIVEKMIQHDISKREHDINVILLELEDHEMEYEVEESFLRLECSKRGVPIDKTKDVMNLFSLSTYFLNNDVNWDKVNLNYNCDYYFKCSDIMKNSLFLCMLHKKLLNIFETESKIYDWITPSHSSFNVQDLKDKENIEIFFNNINIEVFKELSYLKNIIMRYFLSIYDYHAIKMNDTINKIRADIEYNCSDAPILMLTYFVKKNFINSMSIRSSNFVELIKYENSNVYDKNILFIDVEKPFKDFVTKVKKMIPSISYSIRENKIRVFFESLNDEEKFEKIIQKVIENLQENDVRREDLKYIIENSESNLLMKIYLFDSADINVINSYFDIVL